MQQWAWGLLMDLIPPHMGDVEIIWKSGDRARKDAKTRGAAIFFTLFEQNLEAHAYAEVRSTPGDRCDHRIVNS